MNRLALAASLALACSLSWGCGGSKQTGPLVLSPIYRPTAALELQSLSGALVSTPIRMGALSDARSEPRNEVGKSLEEDHPVKVMSPPAELLALFEKGIRHNFEEAGLRVTDDANVVVNFELMRAWVEEDGVYRADVRLKALVEKDGVQTGTMLVGGSAKRWGASLNPDNYEELLSDCLVDAMVHLLNMKEFHAAVAGDETGAAASGGATEPEGPTDNLGGMVE